MNGETPLVSIIMNCLNSAKYLREAIDSVFAQTYANWEIIFWDNASSDASPAIAQSYGDPRLRYFRGATTVPLGAARNLAIAEARGSLIAFLDCDDIWLADKLERQVPLFGDPDVALVYSDTLFFNDAGEERRHYARKQPYRGRCFAELLNRYCLSLETVVIRRSALDTLDGWFDERFDMIEEYDLFVRIGAQWKIDYVEDVLAKWRVHGESWSSRFPDRFAEETRLMLHKLGQSPQIAPRYAAELATAWSRQHVAEALVQWKNGNGAAARRAVLQGRRPDLRSRAVWMASFLPFGVYETLYRLLRPSVRS